MERPASDPTGYVCRAASAHMPLRVTRMAPVWFVHARMCVCWCVLQYPLMLLRGAFPNEAHRLRFAANLRHPLHRAISFYNHMTEMLPQLQDTELESHFKELAQRLSSCLQGVSKSTGVPIDTILQGKVDWLPACDDGSDSPILGSFYAEHLRIWLCELLFHPKNKVCPTLASGKLDGMLATPHSQFLLVDFEELVALGDIGLRSILRHAQLPDTLKGNTTSLPQGNTRKYDHDLSPETTVRPAVAPVCPCIQTLC